MCVYDEHQLAGQDIQYLATNSWSRYTTSFDELKSNVQHLNNPGIPMIHVIKNVIAFRAMFKIIS